MKNKIYLLFVVFVSHVFYSTAQKQITLQEAKADTRGVYVTFNTGFSLSDMIDPGIQKQGSLNIRLYSDGKYPLSSSFQQRACARISPNYKLGVGMLFDITRLFALGFDINYEAKGCQIPLQTLWIDDSNWSSPLNVDAMGTIRLHYLVLPFKTEIHYKMFYFSTGIYTGILLGENRIATVMYQDEKHKFIENVDFQHRNYSWIDFGVFFNTGVRVPLSAKDFLKIGVGGTWNVTGIRRIREGGSNLPYYNQVFTLELRYERKIKEK
ncbi:MAG: outer membrane beta-barrel protein [Bacteroidales bacterium]|jgi:hypothetical protein|nr:outer membrane beta-barrel protein [Bacteroidales bacterium]